MIEERDGANVLKSRYAYGNGIDEPVEIEKENAGAMKSYLPMQDTNGNIIALADNTGKLIEKVNYSSYGQPTFIYDHVAPQVDQVRIADGKILIRFSEAVDKDKAKDAIKIKSGVNQVSGTITFADEDRVAVFTPSAALPQNQALTVSITTQLEDTSGNSLTAEFNQGFTYTGIDIVVFDRVAPETELVNLIANKFTIGLSEDIDQASIASSVVVKRGTTVLTGTIAYENPKTISFTLSNSLTNGTAYTIEINSNLKDLSGKGLAAFSKTFTYQNTDLLVYTKPTEKEHQESFIKNTTLFQGRTLDPETGLYYFRARYANVELGRFLQQDKNGFADSMNPYQSFGNNPVNFSDPMGEYIDDPRPFKKAQYDPNSGPFGGVTYSSSTEGIAEGLLFGTSFAMAPLAFAYDKTLDAIDIGYKTLINPIASSLGLDDLVAKEDNFKVAIDFVAKAIPFIEGGRALIALKQSAVYARAAAENFGINMIEAYNGSRYSSVAGQIGNYLNQVSSFVRKSLPPLTQAHMNEFESVSTKTFKAGQKIYRSPWNPKIEYVDKPGTWYGTRLTKTKIGTNSMYQVGKVGNALQEMRIYEFTHDVTLYYGKVKGGTGYQVKFPYDIDPSQVLKYLSKEGLK